jgi:hypothetical protein
MRSDCVAFLNGLAAKALGAWEGTMKRRIWAVAVLGLSASIANAAVYSSTVMFPLSPVNNVNISTLAYEVIAGEAVGDQGNNNTGSTKGALWTASGTTGLGTDVLGTDGLIQVGDKTNSSGYYDAVAWRGTASTAVDLKPTNLAGFSNTFAQGVSGPQIVGYGGGSVTVGPYAFHALLWTGENSNAAVDLNPTQLGMGASQAFATDGTHQVGVAAQSFGDLGSVDQQAILWQDSAASAVNLTPVGYLGSSAFGVGEGEQVGQGYSVHGNGDAMLWTGSAASAVDLGPTDLAGFVLTAALATNGIQQVGYGYPGTQSTHALVWAGTASSAVDLQTFLQGSATWTDSEAQTIDSSGNIFGYADGTYNGAAGEFAVEWTPIPEPAAAVMLMSASGAACALRRRPYMGKPIRPS